MTVVARNSGKSSEIERGEVPELAELGNVLRELFNTLGISQRQYAQRIHLDPSAVSRYLGGQRRPSQQFVEQLVAAVEEERGSDLTPEAREAVRAKWLGALRACDPDEHQLEVLRDELARARRETERANRNVLALQLLLEQKEEQVRDAAADLVRMRLDWSAERKALAGSRDALLREIEELRNDLREAERLRREAEEHGCELRERVLRLERELAERGAPKEVPLEALKGQLERMWEEEAFSEAARDLTEAAWARTMGEVVDLVAWLGDRGEANRAVGFVTDVCRLRPAEDVVRFARTLVPLVDEFRPEGDALVQAIATRVTPRNVAYYYGELAVTVGEGDWLGDLILAAAVRHVTAAVAVDLIVRASEGVRRLPRFHATAVAVARQRTGEGFPAAVAVGLSSAGLGGAAAEVVVDLCSRLGPGRRSTAATMKFHRGLCQLEDGNLRAFFALLAAQPVGPLTMRFVANIHQAGVAQKDLFVTNRLLDSLGPAFEQFVKDDRFGATPELRDYVIHRRG